MKVLVVTPTFLPVVGGAELGIYEIYQRIGERHDVMVLTPTQPDSIVARQGATDDYFENMKFETRYFADRLNPANLPLPPRISGVLTPFSVSLAAATIKTIREFRPDVINFHYAISCGVSMFLARAIFDIPCVLSLIGRTDVLAEDSSPLRKHMVWWAVRTASLVAPISNYCLSWPRAAAYANVIPYGVDVSRFTPDADGTAVRKTLGIGADVPVLFALQRLSRVKRADIVIEALPEIVRRYPGTILVVGGKGFETAALKSLAAERGVSDNVIFAGYIEERELPGYFAMADIFVFHSTFETFGIVLAQAMASGTPVVSVNTTSIPEVVDNGSTGTLVDPLDPGQFARAVVDLMDDDEKRRKFSRNGREKALRFYSWESVATQYESAFRTLAGNR